MCRSIAKYLLFAFNFIFWLAGAALLGVGIWMNVDPNISQSVQVAGVDIFYAGAYILIAAGSIMLVVGFFGCCGAVKESKCMLGTYFVFLLILFGLEVGIGIYCIVEYDSLEEGINDALDDYKFGGKDDPLAALQQNLQCCGTVNNCTDWPDIAYGCNCSPADVQNASLCVQASKFPLCEFPDPDLSADEQYFYTQPCNQVLSQLISDNFFIIGVVALSIGLAEILGMIIAMSLCCSIKDK